MPTESEVCSCLEVKVEHRQTSTEDRPIPLTRGSRHPPPRTPARAVQSIDPERTFQAAGDEAKRRPFGPPGPNIRSLTTAIEGKAEVRIGDGSGRPLTHSRPCQICIGRGFRLAGRWLNSWYSPSE